jgi:hypothetical protein
LERSQLLVKRKGPQLRNLLDGVRSQVDITERITGLHALFSCQTIIEDVTETVTEGNKNIEKVTGRRYLSIIYSARPEENKIVSETYPEIGIENRTDIFTIENLGSVSELPEVETQKPDVSKLLVKTLKQREIVK